MGNLSGTETGRIVMDDMFCNFGNIRSSSAAQDPSAINSKKSSPRRHVFVSYGSPVSISSMSHGSYTVVKASASLSVESESESGWCTFSAIRSER